MHGQDGKMRKLLALVLLLMLTGCTALNYSQTFIPEYKAKTIAVFPVDSGVHKDSSGVMDIAVAGELADKGWFSKVLSTKDLNACINAGTETKAVFSEYMTKLKMVNFSDRVLSEKIGKACGVQAFVLTTVDQWTYVVEGEDKDKIARVGLSFRVIDAATGKDVWKASHTESEKYLLLKPELKDVARKLAGKMLSEMPH
jgi:hypothetical protein